MDRERKQAARRDPHPVYRLLDIGPLGRSFTGKIFLVVFVATHLPILGLLAYLLGSAGLENLEMGIVVALLVATGIGTAFGWYCLFALLSPMRITVDAIQEYTLNRRYPNLPDEHDDLGGQLMHTVAKTLATIEKTRRSLEWEAAHDPLTGILNPRHGEQALELSMSLARRRSDMPLSVAVLDVDRFKAVNDKYGHLAGDEVLRAIAARMEDRVRESDHVIRWGGDEFLLVLMAPYQGATQVLDELLAGLRRDPIRYGRDMIPVQLSCGVAEWNGTETIPDLLLRADTATYEAKGSGRGQVRVSQKMRRDQLMADVEDNRSDSGVYAGDSSDSHSFQTVG